MRIISINIWCGILFEPLIEYIKKESDQTDVFCFQEVVFHGPAGPITKYNIRGNLYEEIAAALPEYDGYKRLAPEGSQIGADKVIPDGDVRLGTAIFVKKDLTVIGSNGFFVYPEDQNPFANGELGLMTGNFQYIQIKRPSELVTIGTLHGLWQENKDDTPERLEQSRRVLEFFDQQEGVKILMGDLNLRPETESIAMLSRELRNLIAEKNITITRNAYYKDMEFWKDYIADYAFVSPEAKIKEFTVPAIDVSDHLPLVLEIE